MNPQQNNSFLIVGLGNPGEKYNQTRHNIGFRIVDSATQELRENSKEKDVSFKLDKKSNGLIAKAQSQEHQLFFAKPQTFMNLSGKTVQTLSSFFKIPRERILIIHDDIDLKLETIRLSYDSGPAGHNGVKSIIESLGSKQFARLRIGIGRQKKVKSDSFVLKKFSSEENNILSSEIIPVAVQAIFDFPAKGFEKTASLYNRSKK
ncbi:MAG: aminoacyl-tRNA hydrolase [Patescibacteria group bacterium]|nr:aminoacyl-tRNA hydrolase [Patescibacteria group bacterium]